MMKRGHLQLAFEVGGALATSAAAALSVGPGRPDVDARVALRTLPRRETDLPWGGVQIPNRVWVRPAHRSRALVALRDIGWRPVLSCSLTH